MMNARTDWVTFPLVLLTLCVVVGACGGDSKQEASGGPQVSTTLAVDETGENRPPEITAIRFEPPNALPGKLLRVLVGATDLDRDPVEFGYTWKINGRRTPSSESVLELPTILRKGDRIEVSVIASDGKANSEPAFQSALIGNRAPSLQEIQIHVRGDHDGSMGHWAADPSAEDPDGDEISFRYSWIVNGAEIDVATAELDRASRKRGDEIRLIVWATDGEAESAPLESAPFTIANSPPDIESRPPEMDPSGQFIYPLKASDRDGDRGLRYSLEQGPDGMTIDPFSGELRWQATISHVGEHIVEVAVDDRHGGVTNQTFYVHVAAGPAKQR